MLEQQSKINVDFKPSKKMKKRRELDALVSNGKRRKSKSGHELLRSDSESSEIDEFSLSSQKSFIRNRDRVSSACSTCANVFGIFLLGACVLTCIGLLWTFFQMKKDLDDMRNKMATVESKNQGSLESYQDLHGQIQTVNKSLHAIKMDTDKTTLNILNNLKEMSQKITALNTTTESLKEGLKAAPELKQISNKVPVISKSVASLGVDVKAIKTTVEEFEDFRKKTEKQIQQLVNNMDVTKTHGPTRSSALQHTLKPIGNPDFEENTLQKFDSMAQILSQVNSSLWIRLVALQQEVSMHQNHFVMLENVTNVLQREMEKVNVEHATVIKPGTGREQGPSTGDAEKLETKVKDIVHQTINDLDLQNTTAQDSKTLDSLLNNMDNITSIVKSLRKQFQKIIQDHETIKKPDASDAASVTPAPQDVAGKIQNLENLVHSVQRDLQMTIKHLARNTNQLTNLTAVVDGIKRYMTIRDKEQQVTPDKQNVSTTVNVDTTSTPVRTEQLADTSNVSISNTENATSTKKLSTQGPTSTPKVTTRPHLTFGDIKTMQDLDTGFSRWDRTGADRIDPEILKDYMPDPPTKEQLEPYDKNDDGLYSKEELANALGLSKGETNDAGKR